MVQINKFILGIVKSLCKETEKEVELAASPLFKIVLVCKESELYHLSEKQNI